MKKQVPAKTGTDYIRMDYVRLERYFCDKGHKWEHSINGPVPITIALVKPEIEDLCPFCLSELLSPLLKDVGRVRLIQ